MSWEELSSRVLLNRAISTVALLALILVIRSLLLRRLAGLTKLSKEHRRRWMVMVRNSAILALLLGLTLIWAEELRTFAVSVVAIAVALVIATKELILCISGSLLRAVGHSFSIGDRIEVKGVRGHVIDHTLLTTTLLEIGPGKVGHMQTGRTVCMPNSLLLENLVTNESFLAEYMLHVFSVPITLSNNWQKARDRLLAIAREECSAFARQTQESMRLLERQFSLDLPPPEPRVTIQIPESGKVNLVVRIPVPARRRGLIEQKILERFLAEHPGAESTSPIPRPLES